MKDGGIIYPSLSRIRRKLCNEVSSSEEEDSSDYSSAEESTSDDLDMERKSKGKRKGKDMEKTDVDPSLWKDTELFGIDIKSVSNLEAGLTPAKIGKKTSSLFLDQIDDMTSYPRHLSQKSAEGLGDFVEAVSDLNQHRQDQTIGSWDNGWKG